MFISRDRLILTAAAVSAFLSSPACADEGLSIGVSGGTLGIGPEIAYDISESLGLRAQASFLSISREFSSDSITYAGTAKLQSGGLMVDYFPTNGGLRLSAGLRINGNKALAEATPATPVEINGRTYFPVQVGTLSGALKFKSVAPVATLGFRTRKAGIAFNIEAGAMFQGRARVESFRASGGGVAAADLAAEQASVQSDVSKFRVYPVLQLGLGYRF